MWVFANSLSLSLVRSLTPPPPQLNEMIRAPVEGHFWQVDHIRPVYSGGGQCSLDNLQTLCTVCHRAVRARSRSRSKLTHSLTHSCSRGA